MRSKTRKEKKVSRKYAVLLYKPCSITVEVEADSEEEAKEFALVNNSDGDYEVQWKDAYIADSIDAHVADIQEVKS